MIATNSRRARPKLREKIARAFLHEKKTHRRRVMRTSRNILSVVVNDDANDNMSIKRRGASVCDRRSSGHAWKKTSKFETQSFPYHVRDDPIPSRVRGQCSMRIQKEQLAIDSYWNQFFWTISRPSIIFLNVVTVELNAIAG